MSGEEVFTPLLSTIYISSSGHAAGSLAEVKVAGAEEAKPNVVFIMLDDFGYSQLEAYSRGLTEADCDPKLLAHVKEEGGVHS